MSQVSTTESDRQGLGRAGEVENYGKILSLVNLRFKKTVLGQLKAPACPDNSIEFAKENT
jgi:hypothetical protein